MKLRCLASLAFAASILSGCPTNTYPAGDKDAYPLTDEQVFWTAAGGKSIHDQQKGRREQIAKLDPLKDSKQINDLRTEIRNAEKDEAAEIASVNSAQVIMKLVLARLFGSPEHPTSPFVSMSTDVSPVFMQPGSDIEEPGSPLDTGRRLFKQHCIHCHGFYGFGDGPTANFLLPKPRDFRFGKVKFTSTANGMRPTHTDLVRTIAQGVPGTMMPAFGPADGLPEIGIFAGHAGPPGFDVDAVASYVEMLLMRGSVEVKLAAKWNDDGEINKGNAQSAVDSILDEWRQANAKDQDGKYTNVVEPKAPRPANFAASAEIGRKLFGYEVEESKKGEAKAGCFTCHGLHAKGVNSPPEDKALPDVPNDYMLPSMPANLTLGVYRGGRRPIDLYRRLYAGIQGTAMPAQANNLTPEEIWNVVDFIYQIGMSKEKPE
ncbi:MAG TPA: cytochrome c [Planctomycetota bacterium]|nr:cytochrome c [Planctomycetota bacterium]